VHQHEASAAILPARGSVTASAKPIAAAASIALPPWRNISAPTSLAISLWLETMPRLPMTGWLISRYSDIGGALLS